MGRKVLAAKSGRAACSCAAAGGGIAAKSVKDAKSLTQRHKGTEKMKSSGNPWIGDVPEGWEVSRVKHHYELILGKMLCVTSNNEANVRLPYVCAANVHFEGVALSDLKEMWFSTIEVKQYAIREGDLLVVEGGAGAGGAAICPRIEAAVGIQNSIILVRNKNCRDNRYLRYLLEALVKNGYVDFVCNKATIPHFTKDKLGNVPLPLPPLLEQRAIAAYLDEKCGAIDAAIAEAKKGIEEYKAWKISLIDDVVCNGIDRNRSRKETGEDWLSDIPDEWDFIPIRYLFALRDERNDRPLKDVNLISLYTDKGVVQHADIEKTTGNKASTADGYKLVYENDIVVNIILCWMGAVGRSAYNGVTSPAYDVYRPVDPTKVLSRYYHYLFRTPRFNGKCYEEGRGIMMMRWRTYSSEFRAIKVPVPPFEEQQAIADYLDDKCAAIDAMIAEKEALIADLEAYKKSLIFEVVTGKREVA